MGSRSRTIVLLVVIIVGGAYLRSQSLFEPWVGHHNAFAGALNGNIARNFVKYGYWSTGFGPVANSGYVSPDKFEYYYHYPPLVVWLVSLSFHAFGIHEWSARLVPLAFSLALMGLVFIFARRLFDKNIALLALLFSAVMPIESYYGAHVDYYGSVAVFFSLLALYGYARWLASRRRSDVALCVLGIVLGCMTTWYTYFLVPLIIAHYYILCRRQGKSRDHRMPMILAGSAVAVFGLFLLHRQMLLAGGGDEVMGTLFEKLLIRTSLATPSGDRLGVARLVLKHARDLARMYSPPLLLLVGMWWWFFTRDALKKGLQTRDWLVFMLLGYGLLHNVAFPSLLIGHDYLAGSYAPGIAIAASVALVRFTKGVERTRGVRIGNATAVVVLMTTVMASLFITQRLYSWDGNASEIVTLRRWGEVIRKNSNESDLILVSTATDRIAQYYVEREMKFDIDTAEELRKNVESGIGSLFICFRQELNKCRDVLAYLDGRYPRRDVDGLIMYALPRRGCAAFRSEPCR